MGSSVIGRRMRSEGRVSGQGRNGRRVRNVSKGRRGRGRRGSARSIIMCGRGTQIGRIIGSGRMSGDGKRRRIGGRKPG